MFPRLFQRIKRRRAKKLGKSTDYYKGLQRYRETHPESLEEEKKQIQQWISYIVARKSADRHSDREIQGKDNRLPEALHQMREVARAAFMSHPAATEWDFRRCWPSIREEMLKQHALEELAANPALSESFAREASQSETRQPHATSLQLIKDDRRD